MTIHRSTRSLRRLSDSRIADMVRTYALMMTKGELPADFGLTILHKARRIDAEIGRQVEGQKETPARMGGTAGAASQGGMVGNPKHEASGSGGKSKAGGRG